MSSGETFSVRRLSPFNDYKPSFAERPITKIALVALTALFLVGVLISHFTGIGTVAVALFGAAAGVSIVALIVVSVCAVRSKKQREATATEQPRYSVMPGGPNRTSGGGGWVKAEDVDSDDDSLHRTGSTQPYFHEGEFSEDSSSCSSESEGIIEGHIHSKKEQGF